MHEQNKLATESTEDHGKMPVMNVATMMSAGVPSCAWQSYAYTWIFRVFPCVSVAKKLIAQEVE
jgi:hypothetical protein